jgi:hypothetical protein
MTERIAPLDEALAWPWEWLGHDRPPWREPGLYVHDVLVWKLEVGESVALRQIAAIGKAALTYVLNREFSVIVDRVEGGSNLCCPECGTRKTDPPKHADHCVSGAICQRVRSARQHNRDTPA